MDPRDQLDELMPLLTGLVAPLSKAQLSTPTACADFAVDGVLEHMITGATAFAAAFRGEPAPTSTDGADSDRVTAFPAAMTNLQSALRSPGALERTIMAPFGEVPGEAFARFVVLDGLVHGWDISTATDQPYAPTDRLVAEVDAFARTAITPDLRASGAFGPAVEPPTGATTLTALIAFTGREVRSR